ncbi:hypothetical protein [Acidovorax sp. SUPP3334]|uniref:hypothetical protein n=1 Tax=Acidovorax sp. SUPP3334 TaxID=2920881 RepID=UPI0023DE2E21|nr:hypothetical protein [Acidovorax sp. SUPP3334]GKT25372.1 hypothetical protein AVHM3334_17735 [Acidovorax sp. SUPP3334]
MIDARTIRTTEKDVNRLYANCWKASAHRSSTPSEQNARIKAWEEFRSYQSPLWELWTAPAQASIVQSSGYWRRVALLYLELSPRFFRSGYLRDAVAHRLKQADLLASEREAVQASLLSALPRRPSTGHFVHDCRLAIQVSDSCFLSALDHLCHQEDGWTRGRALRMRQAIQQHAKPAASNHSQASVP